MRHELCIDIHNEHKWTIALDVADETGATLIAYIAMLVPDIGKHGNRQEAWESARPEVRDFYDGERTNFKATGAKDLFKITQLDPRIHAFSQTYSYSIRRQYFSDANQWLRQYQAEPRSVVLIDPCNGLADGNNRKSRDLRVRSEEVSTIWKSLRPNDQLLLFQWCDFADAAYSRPIALFAKATHGDVSRVMRYPCGDFSILRTGRPA